MKLFSQRIGKTPIKSVIQTDSIDEDLKNALWNGLTIFYWDDKVQNAWIKNNSNDVVVLLTRIWIHFFKNRLDEMPENFDRLQPVIKKFFYSCEWYQIYDFIEFIPLNLYTQPF